MSIHAMVQWATVQEVGGRRGWRKIAGQRRREKRAKQTHASDGGSLTSELGMSKFGSASEWQRRLSHCELAKNIKH